MKHYSLDEFKKAWVKKFGKPRDNHEKEFLNGFGIKEFYSDFLTSQHGLSSYLSRV